MTDPMLYKGLRQCAPRPGSRPPAVAGQPAPADSKETSPVFPRLLDAARVGRVRLGSGRPMTELEPEALPSAEPGLSIRILVWASEVVAAVSAERVFEHCSVFVADDDRSVLVLAALRWGSGDDTGTVVPGRWVVPFAGSVCGSVYRSGRPALIEDVTGHASYRTYPGAVARSEITVPISSGGRRIGVINLESARAGTFGIADLDQLTMYADHAGATFAAAGLAADLAGHAGSDATPGREP